MIILILFDFFLTHYVFEFQRVTLILSRRHIGSGSSEYQIILTPTWMGGLGWLSTIIHIVTGVLMYINYGWLFLLIYLSFVFAFYALIGTLVPFPTTAYYFQVIKKHLSKEIAGKKANSDLLVQLLKFVEDTERAEKADAV